MAERIKLWRDGLCLYMTSEQINGEIAHALEYHLARTNFSAERLTALTVLQLYAQEMELPIELLTAETMLLGRAHAQCWVEGR